MPSIRVAVLGTAASHSLLSRRALASLGSSKTRRQRNVVTPGPAIRQRLALAASGLCVALAITGCSKQEGSAPKTSNSAPATIPARVLMVCTDATYMPFESQNDKGEIVGFDIDVVNAVAKKEGMEMKFVNTPWEGLFNSLDQGDCDLLAAAITITAERRQTMDFSQPYFDAKQLIAVRSDSTVAKFEDLKPLKVAVQNGTTGDEVVGKLVGKSSTNIKRFESIPLALKELEDGGVQAVVADNGVVAHYLINNTVNGFKTVSDAGFPVENYGIAVKKGSPELLAKINQGLDGIRADGTYAKIYASYFVAESKK